MINSVADKVVLSNGVGMPQLGLGVWQANDPKELTGAIRTAVEAGYRHIDTAEDYGNEAAVGEGIRAAGIPREELFVTSKLWNRYQFLGKQAMLEAFDRCLERMGLEYIDLYLIHWPVFYREAYVTAWEAMLEIYHSGRVRAVGVSNFEPDRVERIFQATGVLPMVNQVELHPWYPRQALAEYCKSRSIQVECYSPLMRGHFTEEPVILELAEKYEKTPAQIILRWDLQQGYVAIPKSVHPGRIRQNAALYDFALETGDVWRLSHLHQNRPFLPSAEAANEGWLAKEKEMLMAEGKIPSA